MSTAPVTPVTPKVATAGTWHLHGYYLVILVLLGIMAHVWLSEHDARVQAEATVKTEQAKEKDLTAQISQTKAAAAVQVQTIQRAITALKTPAQAIAAIPTLSELPLNARPLPADPTAVVVDAVPLAQELGKCRETAVELGSCQKQAALQEEIHAADQAEIKALKKKPAFWHRVGTTLKTIGIGVGIGAVLAGGHL